MSDRAREVITEALDRRTWGSYTDKHLAERILAALDRRTWGSYTDKHLAERILAALEAAGIALVELPQPEPREDDAEVGTEWDSIGDYRVTVWDNYPDEVTVSYNFEPSEPLNPREARRFAAALLAAANRAEATE